MHYFRYLLFSLCVFLLSISPSRANEPTMLTAEWIWNSEQRDQPATCYFRKSFELPNSLEPAKNQLATLRGVADFCTIKIFLNGKHLRTIEPFSPLFQIDVSNHLRTGTNLVAIQAEGCEGPSAIVADLLIETGESTKVLFQTNASWKTSTTVEPNWQSAKEVTNWKSATAFGVVAAEPWGKIQNHVPVNTIDDYHQWKQAQSKSAADQLNSDVSKFLLPDGFEIERFLTANEEQGSWVGMTFDPQGRIVIAIESQGLLRLTLPKNPTEQIEVESIAETLKECRGLLFAHDSLYANANNSKGLFRLLDKDGDDEFDKFNVLYESSGGVGHGRNDLALGPAGKIYAIAGDSVDQPQDMKNRTSPFREQRQGKNTREGHVIRMNADGSHQELVVAGLRNPFGIAFNTDGEMFTFDADAEYDMGSSWYRPTRINHLLPGGDFAWRGVTKSWPPYYPDHPDAAPPTLDIGKSSPTGVQFGTNSNFPSKYQQALFALDWTYGRILAVHMTPRGASYACRAETFLQGKPLNVTNMDFGPDGHMYFVTGGRKTQSCLYRVKYVGKQQSAAKFTPQQMARRKHATESRKLRRQLETYHQSSSSKTVSLIWPHLRSTDPAIRHAARIALEHQPLPRWQVKTLQETGTLTALTASMSLAQGCNQETGTQLINRLVAFEWDKLTYSEKLISVRVAEILLDRFSDLASKDKLITYLDEAYPVLSSESPVSRQQSYLVNRELSNLLHRHPTESFVGKTIGLLNASTNQQEQIQYLFALRKINVGWNDELREAYFHWLARMNDFLGGEGMPTFVKRIQGEASAQLSPDELAKWMPILTVNETADELPSVLDRKFVQEWTESDLEPELPKVSAGRNFARGQEMFAAALCIRCHRMGAKGSVTGPDLTSVSGRFSPKDVLQSILHPSKVVSEKYQNDMIVTVEGKVITGRIALSGDYRKSEVQIVPNPLKPNEITTLSKSEIEAHEKSPVSIMPKGLLNSLTKDEILDLLAYLEAGGNPKHPAFAKGR